MELTKIYYSTKEAAALSGISQKKLRAGCKAGLYPHCWSGRVLKIDLAGTLEAISKENNCPSL